MSQLWSLAFGGDGTLPVLVREGSNININNINLRQNKVYGSSTEYDPINIYKDFAWTKNPKTSRDDVPRINLKEHRIKQNTNVSNLAYSIYALADTGVDLSQSVLIEDLVQGSGKNLESVGKLSQDVFANAPGDLISKTFKAVEGALQKVNIESLRTELFSSNVLQPYNNLYTIEKTGFQYIFPYLTDSYRELANEFGASSQGNLLNGVLAGANDLVDQVTGTFGTLKPGVYIEEAQQYVMGQTGRSISFSIPLLNTSSVEDIAKNWQLIFGLVYQNRPGRITKSVVDIPVIYTVSIPGMLYMPYAFINSLKVDFIGNRRFMKIPSPGIVDSNIPDYISNVEKTIETIIPDAYKLDITLTGLNEETRNFMFESLKSSPGSKVTATES